MACREDRRAAIYVELSDDEYAACLEMMRAGAIASFPNLIRTALWSLGDHMDIEMGRGVFDHRVRGWRRETPTRIQQKEPA